MQYKIENQVKGTRIITGDESRTRRTILNKFIEVIESYGFNEIILPIIEPQEVYTNKAGQEILNQMYTFNDKSNRELCLRPEGTATIQLLADEHFKGHKDKKFWYFTPCYRYERPQAGRYREFYQFGVEWLNPSTNAKQLLINIAEEMLDVIGINKNQYNVSESVKRGLDYYTEDGFEISAEELGAQKQILGGGSYKQGIGFAFGFDRVMLLNRKDGNK